MITLALPNGIVGDGMFSHAILEDDSTNIKYSGIEIYGITLDAGTTGMSLGKRSKKHPYAWRIYAGAGAATEGTYTVTVDYLYPDGSTGSVSATGYITKDGNVPTEPAHLTSATCSAMPSGKVGTLYSATCTATCSDADDGSYTYLWTVVGNSTGVGHITGGNTNPTCTIDSDGTGADRSGTVNITCKITDSYGVSKSPTSTITISS